MAGRGLCEFAVGLNQSGQFMKYQYIMSRAGNAGNQKTRCDQRVFILLL